jgi:hypothetical protein
MPIPKWKKVVNDMKAHPPTMKEMGDRILREYGVPLYPGVTLQLKAMETYTYDIWGGLAGYWFLSKDMPDKVIAYYEKVLGGSSSSGDVVPQAQLEITDANHVITGHIAIYQGTTALNFGQEPEDADANDVLNVTTLGFLRGSDVGALSEAETGAGSR